jgi:hypothetical protein
MRSHPSVDVSAAMSVEVVEDEVDDLAVGYIGVSRLRKSTKTSLGLLDVTMPTILPVRWTLLALILASVQADPDVLAAAPCQSVSAEVWRGAKSVSAFLALRKLS